MQWDRLRFQCNRWRGRGQPLVHEWTGHLSMQLRLGFRLRLEAGSNRENIHREPKPCQWYGNGYVNDDVNGGANSRWKSLRTQLPRLDVPLLRAAQLECHRWDAVPSRRPLSCLRRRILQGRNSFAFWCWLVTWPRRPRRPLVPVLTIVLMILVKPIGVRVSSHVMARYAN